jgi:hypothetical protein
MPAKYDERVLIQNFLSKKPVSVPVSNNFMALTEFFLINILSTP